MAGSGTCKDIDCGRTYSMYLRLTTRTLLIWQLCLSMTQTIHNIALEYCYIKLLPWLLWSTIVPVFASPVLHQVLLALAYLAVSLVLVATKATFMAKESATVTFWMISE